MHGEWFWQHDRSRSRTGENAGLGLSIAQRAAKLAGARLEASRGDGDEIAVTTTFPLECPA